MPSLLSALLIALCVLAPAQPATRESAPQPLVVISSNIRNSGMDDGPDAWPLRKAFYFQALQAHHPDLIGFQEVLKDQQADLVAALPDYGTFGVGRDDGKTKGEYASIFYRKDRFEVLTGGTFWLSPTPESVGSVGWDAALTRICTWAHLKDRSNGREFFYANTHFDHVGETARVESAKLIATRLKQIAPNDPLILTGDFNTTEDTPPYATLMSLNLRDAYRETHPKISPDEASFHGFKGDPKGLRIDWILHTDAFAATDATIDHARMDNGHYPSDHFPVTATLQWK